MVCLVEITGKPAFFWTEVEEEDLGNAGIGERENWDEGKEEKLELGYNIWENK